MGSEQIHFEALRKQMIMDRRNTMNIQKKVHQSMGAELNKKNKINRV